MAKTQTHLVSIARPRWWWRVALPVLVFALLAIPLVWLNLLLLREFYRCASWAGLIRPDARWAMQILGLNIRNPPAYL
jgi:hypothetical protein